MKTTIVSRKYYVTNDLKERLDRKLSKLDKFFTSEADTSVTFSEERGRHRVEITIFYKGTIFRAEVFESDPISSIDKAVSIIERQIRKNKTKLEKRLHGGGDFSAFADMVDEPEENIKISKIKKFAVKPMTVEEAVLQMNLIGHEFFLFLNEETEEINVVYKRKNDDYGVIVPEI